MKTLSTALVVSSLSGMYAADAGAGAKPNIVFLLVDDLGWTDVGYQGKRFNTPNIDQLAKDGMVFTDAYAACPVCSPTRASIVTGKYPARLKMGSHIPSMGGRWRGGRPLDKQEFSTQNGVKTRNWLPTEEVTMAEALKAQGYYSGFIGKWHLGHEPYHPVKQGFDEQVGTCNFGQPPSYHAPYTRTCRKEIIAIEDLKQDATPQEYLTDRLTKEACSFISKRKGKGPFLCYMSYYTVHTPLQPRKDLAHLGNYGGMIAALDESVGKIREHLKKEGLDKNTVVVFMSDNGGLQSNAPLRSKKGSTYEGGIREPMIVHWPGVTKPKSTCSVPVTSTDFFPTFVEIAGGDPNKTTAVDGVSLVPLLKGKKTLPRKALFWHFPHRRPIGNSGAIRMGDYKLIEKFEDGKLELYNLFKDIGETTDLAGKEPAKVKELHDRLKAWRKALDAPMPPKKDARP